MNIGDNQQTIRKPLIIAHRGFSAAAPENSIKAFKAAITAGADMIEFDVRKTEDSTLIVHHNKTFARKRIADSRYHELTMASYRGGIGIPTLKEVLDLAAGRIKLDIELKERGYELEVVEVVQQYCGKSDFIISSFHLSSLRTVKKAYPDVLVGFIMGSAILRPIALHRYKGDFLIVHHRLATSRLLDNHNDKRIYVWTVNSPGLIRRFLADKRIAGIITDKPDVALALRAKQ